MLLPQPLHLGRLIKRYKRFLADVRLDDGTEVTAHCADPGRLPGLAVAGARVWLSYSSDPKRKLAYRLELIEHLGQLVGLNTNNANKLADEALRRGLPEKMAATSVIRREVRYGNDTRFDFMLEQLDGAEFWLEVKNVTWRDSGMLAFPDAVTSRGTKHLTRLTEIVRSGGSAGLLFIAQRSDVVMMRIAGEIDPTYARAFASAVSAGVHVWGIGCSVSVQEIRPMAMIGIACDALIQP